VGIIKFIKYMATLSKAAFEALYGTNGTTFPDNTTGEISEGDVRQFGQDIADSLYNVVSVSGPLTFIVLEIGDWNMDTDAISAGTAHGLTLADIRTVSVTIRNDDGSVLVDLLRDGYFTVSSTNVTGFRTNSGAFDSVDFNATSYNRGWITIGYV
jgi:hypothetical protein